MLTTLNAALPLFSSVTACAVLLVPTAWMPKDRLDGERFTTDAAPAKFTVCGLPEALSLMLRSPARGPPSVGANNQRAAATGGQIGACRHLGHTVIRNKLVWKVEAR